MALSRTRTAVLTALTTAVAVALLAFGWAGASQAQRLQAPSAQAAAKLVAVKDDFFSPRSTSTSSGRVTFVWRGSSVHNVVFTRAPGSKGALVRAQKQRQLHAPVEAARHLLVSLHSPFGHDGQDSPVLIGRARRRR